MDELVIILRYIQSDITALVFVLMILIAVIVFKPMGGNGKK